MHVHRVKPALRIKGDEFGNLIFQYDLDQSGVSSICFSCQKLEYAQIRFTLI
jgi:hypothetical protein